MQTKRFLSLFVAVLLCFSSFQSFAEVAAADIEIDLDEIYADDIIVGVRGKKVEIVVKKSF